MNKAGKIILAIVLPILIVFVSSVLIFIWHIRYGGVVLNPEQLHMQENSTLLAADGSVLLTLSGDENRTLVSLDEISNSVVQALLATEDRSFYQHNGVDGRAVIRAFLANQQAGTIVQGGSTITQQLVKLCYLSPEQSFHRKVQEAYMALLFEQQYSKDQILEFYLNNVYFGSGAYGIEQAAQIYFAKRAVELDEREAAYLVALLKAPHYYAMHEEEAKNRCQQVMQFMQLCGYLENIPDLSDLQVQGNRPVYRGDYLADYAIEEAEAVMGSAVPGRGLIIETAIDPELQAGLCQHFSDPANFPLGKGGQPVQGAAVIMDVQSGEVVGMIGGRDYHIRGLNRAAHSLRQPGSAVKPVLVYAPALQSGMKPDDWLEDKPSSYQMGDGTVWTPQNYDHQYRGRITMREAVKRSVNTCAVAVMDELGVDTCIALAEKLGISSLVKKGAANDCTLAAALGGLTRGVSPLEMAGAYAVFAREGDYIKPHVVTRITDTRGNVLYEFDGAARNVLTPEEAMAMTDMLVDVVHSGTGTRASIAGMDVAGKTGTSETLRDAWFVGYTPSLVCAVWMGFDQGLSMDNVAGGDQPARLFQRLMSYTLNYQGIHEDRFVGLPPRKQKKQSLPDRAPAVQDQPAKKNKNQEEKPVKEKPDQKKEEPVLPDPKPPETPAPPPDEQNRASD